MCGGFIKKATLPSNSVAVDGGKTVTVTSKDGIVKVVTGRNTGRKDTFTLPQSSVAALVAALQNA